MDPMNEFWLTMMHGADVQTEDNHVFVVLCGVHRCQVLKYEE